ncbi:MAG: type II toxin-antitoxin system prevent-host-death family antitoxin [Oscillospiraceae bacterium]|jgi:prevent-host-death family protein|nr:type II toxin-antitoxin system prevent-host-death family antitoxin [Oscillospiraceae bacterium]
MKQVNIHEAKTHLSALVERAAAGESFIIAKSGRPLVVVSSYAPAEPPPRTGFLKGQVSVPADFDHIGSPEIEDMFGGAL